MSEFYNYLVNYLVHLVGGFALLAGFVFIYVRVTPFAEFALIRQGLLAPALSLGGAVLGFALTLAASIISHASPLAVLAWAVLAGVVQVLTYALLSRSLPGLTEALEEDNVAMGALMGCAALVVGVLNAACLS